MKKRCVLCFLFATIILLQSCSGNETYIAEYPYYMNAEYCLQNYVGADPNLSFFTSAENTFGSYKYSGLKWQFFALKNIPMDKYLCTFHRALILDRFYGYTVLKHKDVTEEPIIDYSVSSGELYWGTLWFGDLTQMQSRGHNTVVENIGTINADMLQNHIINCINNKNFENTDGISPVYGRWTLGGVTQDFPLIIRLYFSEYENLIWETHVHKDTKGTHSAKYYVVVHYIKDTGFSWENKRYYTGDENYGSAFIPLPEEYEHIIDEAIYNKE